MAAPWLGLLLAGSAIYGAVVLTAYAMAGRDALADFFGFWSAARYAAGHAAAGVYSIPLMDAYQHALLPPLVGSFRFLYPPDFLLLMLPFGMLPYGVACALWVVLGFAAYLAAMWLGGGLGRLGVAALLVAPGSAIAIFYGQTGLVAAALLIGGLRLLGRRPILAGILLGLLTMKPHLGLLVPAALLAAGCRRSIVAAIATAATGVAASAVVFGLPIWMQWAGTLLHNPPTGPIDRARLDALQPTLTGNLDLVGVPAGIGTWCQAGLAVAVMGLVWLVWRRGPSRLGVALVAAGALLATPYAFVYDMPLCTAAVLLVAEDAVRTGRRLHAVEAVWLAAVFLAPAWIFTPVGPSLPLGAPLLVGLVAMIARRALHMEAPDITTAAAVS